MALQLLHNQNRKTKIYRFKIKNLTNESVSLKLIELFLLKNNQKELIKTINNIKKIPKEEIKRLYDFQPLLDFWYYTKLLGYKNEYKPNESLIKRFISKEKIENINSSLDAVYMYVYIRVLVECDYKKYKNLKKYFSFLESIITQNYIVYGYYLTHIILYNTKFGKIKDNSISSIETLEKLNNFSKNKLKFERKEFDLIAEIVLCCNLLNKTNFPYYSKMKTLIKQTNNYLDLHEKTVLNVVNQQTI